MSTSKKHDLSLIALFAITTWFIATIIGKADTVNWLSSQKNPVILPAVPESIGYEPGSYSAYSYLNILDIYLPYIAAAYLLGLAFQIGKLGFAWNAINRIKHSLSPATDLTQLINQLSEKIGIKKTIGIGYTQLINVPGIIGYTKPLILIPFSFTCNLSPAEAETILLHELAHIKRNDFIINLIQRAINVILFFNPFVQLINIIIDKERENCCDDLVVKVSNSPLLYAHALLKLEQTGNENLKLALAAKSNRYHLLSRINRIMETEKLNGNTRYLIATILLFISCLSSIAWIRPQLKDASPVVEKTLVQKQVKIFDKEPKSTFKKSLAKGNIPIPPKEKPNTKDEFYDHEIEKLWAEYWSHAKIILKIQQSPRYDTPELATDMTKLEAQLKSERKYSPEFQKRADSMTMEFEGYPILKCEFILMADALQKISDYLTSAKHLQKIQNMSANDYIKYQNYLKKFENL